MPVSSPAGVPAQSTSRLLENSGKAWVRKFPTSKRVDDLEPIFRSSVKRFLGALADADVAITISATRRPRQRAYLASLAAAREMVSGYQIGTLRVAPSLTSLHMEGQAIDMTLRWDGEINIEDAAGKTVTIRSLPRSGINPDLIKVGATYGVRHLIAVNKDPPHWSVNGH